MALSVTLEFDSNSAATKKYMVVKTDFHFERRHTANAPDAKPYSREVSLEIVAPDADNLELYEWYIDDAPRSGRIVITDETLNGESTRTISCSEGRCFFIKENYDINIAQRVTMSLKFNTGSIVIENTTFVQP